MKKNKNNRSKYLHQIRLIFQRAEEIKAAKKQKFQLETESSESESKGEPELKPVTPTKKRTIAKQKKKELKRTATR